MQGYGPITVTQNTVTGQTVDPGANRVLISNRSVYDILVSFANTQPLASTVCSPQWPVFVHGGDQVVYTLQKSDFTPTPLLLSVGEYWGGNVWVCPIGRQTGLTSTGTISTSNQVFFVALRPGDETPTLAARPTNVDASSQQRVISVPVAPQIFGSHGANVGNGFTWPFATPNQGEGFNGLAATGYIHSWHIMVSTAGVQVNWALDLIGKDFNGNVIATQNIVQFWHYGQGSNQLSYSHPPYNQMQYTATVVTIQFQWRVISVSAATAAAIAFSATLDNSIGTQQPVPPIGTGNPLFNTSPLF